MLDKNLRVLAGVSLAGVASGHMAAYFLAIPDSGLRGLVLSSTGHSYGRAGLVLAIGLGLVSAMLLAVRHLRAAIDGVCEQLPGRRNLFALLAVLQLGGFTILEVSERAISGSSVFQMLGGRMFTVGLLAQLAAAFLLTTLLRWLARAAQIIGERLRSAPPAADRPSYRPSQSSAGYGRTCPTFLGRGPPPRPAAY